MISSRSNDLALERLEMISSRNNDLTFKVYQTLSQPG